MFLKTCTVLTDFAGSWVRISEKIEKYPYRLPLLVIECKMPILFLIYPIYIHRHYHHSHVVLKLMTHSQQRPSWLSWQSVALDSRVVSLILNEGLGVVFFTTVLGWVSVPHSQNILIDYLTWDTAMRSHDNMSHIHATRFYQILYYSLHDWKDLFERIVRTLKD